MEIKLTESDFHLHIKARMMQRGITDEEIEKVLNDGYEVDDAKKGTFGKGFVFPYNREWERNFFEEKEVRVYYKFIDDKIVLLTAKARYGKF